MNRRYFIRTLLTAAAGLMLPMRSRILHAADNQFPDLVAVKGASPGRMLDAALKAGGGISRWVHPNMTVAIKPNIGWDVSPERAANTNPELISRLVRHCKDAGAAKVYVFDHTCDNWTRSYRNSGIEDAVKQAGGIMAPAHRKGYYQSVTIDGGTRLNQAIVHELLLESDVRINVPILKHHGSADLSIAMKNLMGVVWNRGYWHLSGLHRCIADFASSKLIDLNIVDAYRMLTRNGPRGVSEADVQTPKMLLMSTDMVAADAAATKIFGQQPQTVDYIRLAHAAGLGQMDLSQLNIQRINL